MIVDLAGTRFGTLVVVRLAEPDYFGKSQWVCQCDCGVQTIVRANALRRGTVSGCGCTNPRRTTHGRSKTPAYRSWACMIRRCLFDTSPNYRHYGGRGITVCEEWKKFENFHRDMGERPVGYQLDRIDNDGNYEPGNCRWVTPKENSNNRRRG